MVFGIVSTLVGGVKVILYFLLPSICKFNVLMVEIGNMKPLLSKALEIRYILMDCYLVDIHRLPKAFVGDRI